MDRRIEKPGIAMVQPSESLLISRRDSRKHRAIGHIIVSTLWIRNGIWYHNERILFWYSLIDK